MVSCLQAKVLDLAWGHIDVVWGGEIVVVKGAQEGIAILYDFKYTLVVDDSIKLTWTYVRFLSITSKKRFCSGGVGIF